MHVYIGKELSNLTDNLNDRQVSFPERFDLKIAESFFKMDLNSF